MILIRCHPISSVINSSEVLPSQCYRVLLCWKVHSHLLLHHAVGASNPLGDPHSLGTVAQTARATRTKRMQVVCA